MSARESRSKSLPAGCGGSGTAAWSRCAELMASGAGAGLTATRRINCRAAACTLMRPAACRDVAQQGKRRICDPLLLPAMSCYINGLRDVVGGFGTGMALAPGSVASIGMTRTG